MSRLTADTLLNLGFTDVAVWVGTTCDIGIDFEVDGPNAGSDRLLLRERNSLYAFVHGDEVKYIGKTSQTLRERFAGYRNPHQGQSTNWRCNGNIREMLGRNEVIRIFAFNPLSSLRYGVFELNLAAGLEDSLIAEFNPAWNGRERGRAITEEAEREKVDEVAGTANISPTATEPPPRVPDDLSGPVQASFHIILGEAYYEQGLINPGVEASARLGDHDDPIEITFSDGSESVISRIDRRANGSGAVRIVGRNRLIAQWFQKHFSRGDTVQALILNRHRILVLSKSVPQ
jgi:hypothetical protein